MTAAMESSPDLAGVCESLDQVTLDLMDTLESLYQSQARLEAVMRAGFLSMSRARYSMGGTRAVGALQFDKNEMEMEAVSVVDVSVDDGERQGVDAKGDGPAWTGVDLSLVHKQAGTTQKIDSGKTKTSDDLLRHRKGHKKETAVETIGMQKVAENEIDGDESSSKEERRLQDPLKLFGVLVSPHLRQCQGSFKQALAAVVEVANLKNRLQGLQAKFQDLMTQKKSLLAS